MTKTLEARVEALERTLSEVTEVLNRHCALTESGAKKYGSMNEEDLYDAARKLAITEGKMSISLLQRRFKIGYGRACAVMTTLEEKGIVAPSDGTVTPRKVLKKK
jgi:DNA segregation ATPase FtsK/SpoIIIE, S-DNA-T family